MIMKLCVIQGLAMLRANSKTSKVLTVLDLANMDVFPLDHCARRIGQVEDLCIISQIRLFLKSFTTTSLSKSSMFTLQSDENGRSARNYVILKHHNTNC